MTVDKLKADNAGTGSFFSCLDGARFDGFNENCLQLKFTSSFQKDVIARPANIKKIEAALAAVSGKNLKLILTTAAKNKAKRSLPAAKNQLQDTNNSALRSPLSELAKPAAVMDAMNFFGAKATEIKRPDAAPFDNFDDVPPPSDDDYDADYDDF